LRFDIAALPGAPAMRRGLGRILSEWHQSPLSVIPAKAGMTAAVALAQNEPDTL
jgi:hypothetical protein